MTFVTQVFDGRGRADVQFSLSEHFIELRRHTLDKPVLFPVSISLKIMENGKQIGIRNFAYIQFSVLHKIIL